MAGSIKDGYWEEIIQAIKETPNDLELAAKIRKLYWKMPAHLKKRYS